jgi:hypothetical protein
MLRWHSGAAVSPVGCSQPVVAGWGGSVCWLDAVPQRWLMSPDSFINDHALTV